MSHFRIFTMLLVFIIPIIWCKHKKHEDVLVTSRTDVMKEYMSTEFDFFKNPWTLYWKFGLEPTCNFFRKTIRTICYKIYLKLKHEKELAVLEEENKNFSYGCYQFRIPGVKNKDKSDRIQRVNRCPFALKSDGGANIFLSFCYTKPNSYFVYAAKELSKKGWKIDKQNVKDADIIALVSAGKDTVWVWTETPKIT